MLEFLIENRIRPVMFSAAWSLVWARRLKALPELIRCLWIRWVLARRGAVLGSNSVFGRINLHGRARNVTIGDFSSFGIVYIQAHDKVTIGRCVVINDGVKLITGSHDINSPTYDHECKPISIGNYAWIATDAMILPGVTVGEAAVVAARSVVTRNVEPFSVVAGNPARKIGNREIINFAYLPSSWFGAICAWVDRNPSIKEMQNSNIKGTAQ